MDIHESLLTPKLIDALYTEAMVLADEARAAGFAFAGTNAAADAHTRFACAIIVSEFV